MEDRCYDPGTQFGGALLRVEASIKGHVIKPFTDDEVKAMSGKFKEPEVIKPKRIATIKLVLMGVQVKEE